MRDDLKSPTCECDTADSHTRMLIIGGTGETGSWFASYFKQRFLVSVWGPSRNVDKAKALGVSYSHDLQTDIKNSDVVVISVPIDRTVDVIRETAPLMRSGSLIMDVTSLKADPMQAMDLYAPSGVEVLGTHPMFGPTMKSLQGQTIILTPIDTRTNRWLPTIRGIFESDGARIEVLQPKEHDRIMAVVQALTHFAYISIGSTLKALDFDVEHSRRFMSPVYEIMLDFIGRILDQNPELYASIQKNPLAKDVRESFIVECKRLSSMLDFGDVEGFENAMKQASTHYGDTHNALLRSDLIINRRAKETTK